MENDLMDIEENIQQTFKTNFESIDMNSLVGIVIQKTPKGNLSQDIYETNGYSLVFTQAIRQNSGSLENIVYDFLQHYKFPKNENLMKAIYSRCLDKLGAGNCGESASSLIAEISIFKAKIANNNYRYVTTASFNGNYDHAFNVFFNASNDIDFNTATVGDKWLGNVVPFMDYIKGQNPYGVDFSSNDNEQYFSIDRNNYVDLYQKNQYDDELSQAFLFLEDKIDECVEFVKKEINNAIDSGNITIALRNGKTYSAKEFMDDIKKLKNASHLQYEVIEMIAKEIEGAF